MGRPVVLSNGEMLVCLNEHGLVHDFYFPYVGQENAVTSRSVPHKLGVWIDGKFSWTDDGSWDIAIDHEAEALISVISMRNTKLNVQLELRDAVDIGLNAFVRTVQVRNLSSDDREIRLFMHQVFQLSRDGREDTAFYEPDGNYIFDYKGQTTFLIYGRSNNGACQQFAVGNYGIEGKSGTYHDAEDGELSGNLVEHGGVDSVLGFTLQVDANGASTVEYWIAAGRSQQEAIYVHNQLLTQGLIARLNKTRNYFNTWLATARQNMQGLSEDVQKDICKSLLVVKSHADSRGAIIASGDSSIYNYGRDYYAYSWPRDGAYAIWPLIKLGYWQEAKSFFEFCRRVIHRDGYLQHKFQPDGSYGSTWHPLMQEHHRELAIQEDETALVLYMLAEYIERFNDLDYFRTIYADFVKPATSFLANYIDANTGLPHASYDLWEQKFQTSTYTVFLVENTLRRMAQLASSVMNDQDSARWVVSAETIQGNVSKLFNKDLQYYIKGVYVRESGEVEEDTTLDTSSMYGAMMFGTSADSFALAQTVDAIEKQLVEETPNGGVSRYYHDGYLRRDEKLPGNPWFICTMWVAQYYHRNGKHDEAEKLLDWIQQKRLPSGVFSEQIDPPTGEQVGVAPLIWSHAEYINTLLLLKQPK